MYRHKDKLRVANSTLNQQVEAGKKCIAIREQQQLEFQQKTYEELQRMQAHQRQQMEEMQKIVQAHMEEAKTLKAQLENQDEQFKVFIERTEAEKAIEISNTQKQRMEAVKKIQEMESYVEQEVNGSTVTSNSLVTNVFLESESKDIERGNTKGYGTRGE
jgi:hypothetical protein